MTWSGHVSQTRGFIFYQTGTANRATDMLYNKADIINNKWYVWSQSKCSKHTHTYWSYTLMLAGTPLMKPISFLLLMTRTPMCQSRVQPGGCRALCAHIPTDDWLKANHQRNNRTLRTCTELHTTQIHKVHSTGLK